MTGLGGAERLYLQVEPSKLTAAEYEFLLQDLHRVAYGIVYALYAPPIGGYSGTRRRRIRSSGCWSAFPSWKSRRWVLHLVRMLPVQQVIVPERH